MAAVASGSGAVRLPVSEDAEEQNSSTAVDRTLDMCLVGQHVSTSGSLGHARGLVDAEAAKACVRPVVAAPGGLRPHDGADAVDGTWSEGGVAGDLVDVDGRLNGLGSGGAREEGGEERRQAHGGQRGTDNRQDEASTTSAESSIYQ